MIKHGSKFINAVSNSGVPHITILMGASYGAGTRPPSRPLSPATSSECSHARAHTHAGNYGMCGRAYKPRFLFSWPNSKCSVMGPDQLTGVRWPDFVISLSMCVLSRSLPRSTTNNDDATDT